MTRAFRLIGIFAVLFLITLPSVNAALRTQSDWVTTARISEWLSSVSDSPLPGLEPPALFPEKPFTKGYQDTLYWSSDSVQSKLPNEMTLLFFEIRANYVLNPLISPPDTVRRWGFVEAWVDSAVFSDLPENVPILYALRYYVRLASGEYGLSAWSKTETSIQDAHIPVLDVQSTYVIGLKRSVENNWVKGSVCSLFVAANDPNGIVQLIRIKANGGPYIDDNNFEVSDSIRYTMIVPFRAEPRIPFNLEVSVFDAAGQQSNIMIFNLAVWPEEDQNRMMAFPNPFNPEKGKASIFLPGIHESTIYDLFGHLILNLKKDASDDFFEWDGRNESGEPVSNGGYIIVASGSKTKCKIAVVR